MLGVAHLLVFRLINFTLVHSSLHDHNCDENGVDYEITDSDRCVKVAPPEQDYEGIGRRQQKEDGVANEAVSGHVDGNDRSILFFTSLQCLVHDKGGNVED